ncbi:hypothetical protein [Actinomadura miaoliensis]|uniref:Uncharacterized protein n=1 Tax=Actinomadura miaoliensis TaxID=430685 RepID=A0ABP7W4V4_9ACTN
MPRVRARASPYPADFNGSHLTLHDRHVAEFTAALVRHLEIEGEAFRSPLVPGEESHGRFSQRG